jgi:hypothetical protein
MNKKIVNKNNNKTTLDQRHKMYMGISIVSVVLLIVVVGIFVAMPRTESFAGKAFHAEKVEALTGELDAQLSFSDGYAAPGDSVEVLLKIKSPANLARVSFEIIYDDDCLTPVGKPLAKSSLTSITEPAADPVDPEDKLWGFFTMGAGPVNEFIVATQKYKVKPGVNVNTECFITIRVADIIEQNEEKTKLNNDDIIRTATITIAPSCNDLDGDGFGTDTGDYAGQVINLKACKYPDVEDCNDGCGSCFPAYPGSSGIGAKSAGKEVCDKQNNDCNADTADGSDESAPLNDLQQGVCYQTEKTCGTTCQPGGDCWENNYPETYFGEKDVTETCDFIDHDCDGSPVTATNDQGIETEIECEIGGGVSNVGEIGSKTPGNIWVEYDPATNKHATQTLGNLDTFFLEQMKSNIQCGYSDQNPCSVGLTEKLHIWYCRDGIYYVQPIVNGVLTGKISKFSPEEDLVKDFANNADELPFCS